MVSIGVLSLQGAVSEHLEMLRRCGAAAVAVKTPPDLEALEGLIIPGGESTTIGSLMDHFGLKPAILKRYREGMALFGTCAGMVLLAREIVDGTSGQHGLGLMEIKVRRNAFGRQKESFETLLQVKGFDAPLEAVFIRAPVIVEARPPVEALASLEEGIVAARQGRLLATSFHPELAGDTSLHRHFINISRGRLC